ncbi:hypothetical protein KAR91_21225 [Candidatus Pacearchaeota archaeon]|nr:hypothetical protein [Candidatus Pacearchaeota archaeon]
MMVKIDSVKIVRVDDPTPDLSYLGEFSNDRPLGARQYHVIVHSANPQEPKFFIADNVVTVEEAQENYDKFCTHGLNWNLIGITAIAIVSYPIDSSGNRRCQELQSSGLWRIDSESNPDVLHMIENGQLSDLQSHLAQFYIETPNILRITK